MLSCMVPLAVPMLRTAKAAGVATTLSEIDPDPEPVFQLHNILWQYTWQYTVPGPSLCLL